MTLTPILMYHATGETGPDAPPSWRVTAEQFRSHLDALAEAGYTGVSAEKWLAARQRAQRERMVVLTFDDGLASNVRAAIPLLREREWSGTFFVISGKMGAAGFASASDWRSASSAGMEVASHTATHPFMAVLPEDEALRELSDSRTALEDAIGAAVTGFSWPNGDAHRRGHALLRAAGYQWAATSRAAFASARTDPLDLPRLAVRAWHDADGLMRLLNTAPVRRARMLATCQARRLARSILGRALYARLQSRAVGDG